MKKITLREKLLQVFTAEELESLELAEGVSLDDEIENETTVYPYFDKKACVHAGHIWLETIPMIHGIGKRECRICGLTQISNNYIYRSI